MKEAILQILSTDLSLEEKANKIETLFDIRMSELYPKVGDIPDCDYLH